MPRKIHLPKTDLVKAVVYGAVSLLLVLFAVSFLPATRLTPVTPMPRLPVVICKPDFPISTPELFRRVDARTSRCRPDTEGICAALADGDMPRLARRMYNVFEDVLTHREGEIAAIKSRLLDGGALGAVMSGTGSAVFGLFADADSAAYAKRRLARDYAECFLTETIDRLEV